jgi:hypothetical protein
MDVQLLPRGRVKVRYETVDYQSPLWIVSSSETEVIYAEEYQGAPVARVYKKGEDWYLSTAYLGHWQPIDTLSKYEGFLLLLNIHKRQKQ